MNYLAVSPEEDDGLVDEALLDVAEASEDFSVLVDSEEELSAGFFL
jgi:hypothetical protein